MKLANFRHEYTRARLVRDDAPAEPFALFQRWLQDAIDANVHEPNAMTLATVDAGGRPSARVVLLKGLDSDPAGEQGFRFFTNYKSRKAQNLADNPHAALVFWWDALERQVRIEGAVGKLSDADSDAYYQSRPKGSRLGAWASAQSTVIESREVLEERLAELETRYAESDPPRPDFWGGYRLVPSLVEFWQGGPNRLHDRLRYLPAGEGWRVERLAP